MASEKKSAKIMRKAFFPTPSWLDEGVVLAGNIEPLAFRRRIGSASAEEEKRYLREHTEAAMKKLLKQGVNFVITHFHKGMGLEAESEEIALTRKMVRLCRKNGIKVGVYLRFNNIFDETFLLHYPEARKWVIETQQNVVPGFAGQVCRQTVCLNNPGTIAYAKKVIRFAVEKVKPDLIHFDGFSDPSEGENCLCRHCQKKFTAFLKSRYGKKPKLAKERFGHTNLENIKIPVYRRWYTPQVMETLRDPVLQEWTDFKCWKTAELAKELRKFISTLKPKIPFDVNTQIFVETNPYYYLGFDLDKLAPYVDALWTEDPHQARLTDDGVLVSRIRHFKFAHSLNTRVFSINTRPSGEALELSLAESLAFNKGSVGKVGWVLDDAYDFPEIARITRFRKKNIKLFKGAESFAEVAVWRSYRTLAYNLTNPYLDTLLWEQTLIQGHIPFDIIFDSALDDLSRYKVLILPDVRCIDSRQMDIIRKFASGGGGVVASGKTSLCDEWNRPRRWLGLADLFGTGDQKRTYSATPFCNESEPLAEKRKTSFGKGRAVFIPHVLPAKEVRFAIPGDEQWGKHVQNQFWGLPKNFEEMVKAVEWASGKNLSFHLTASKNTAAEVNLHKKGLVVIHLVNYDRKKHDKNLKISLETASFPPVEKAFSIDVSGEKEPIPVGRRAGKINLLVKDLDLYKIVVTAGKLGGVP